MVDSRDAITVAALRDVNLRKRCVALPRYIVYVYGLEGTASDVKDNEFERLYRSTMAILSK